MMKVFIAVINLLLISSVLYAGGVWDLRKIAVDAKASSEEGDQCVGKALDSDLGTRWSSKFLDNQWIYIDLGKPCKISGIKLIWETACAKEYRIEVSNDLKVWNRVKEVNEGKAGEASFAFPDLSARAVRVYGIKRATQWGFSLYEFIVSGPYQGIEPEHGGLVKPANPITIYDLNCDKLGQYFAEELAKDPVNSKRLTDDQFLDLIEKRAFDYFWYEVHPQSLYVIDSTTWKTHTSVAGIGLQIAAYVIGHYRKYRNQDEIYKRVEKLLENCYDDPKDPGDLCIEHHSGWVYHWVNIVTGKWEGQEHVCTHDSIMYLCGVIAAKHYFAGTKAGAIASKIIDSVDWKWIIHDGLNKRFISNCYSYKYDPPCGGEVRFYDGMKFDYLMPIGGKRSSVPEVYWHNYAQDYPWEAYKGHFWRIERPALWIHQWDNLWFDFRYMKDDYTDYFQNSVEATLANRQWALDEGWYDENLWGINPCMGPGGDGGAFYKSYGAPPDKLPFQTGVDNDFTINTAGAIPSILFTPKESIKVARTIYDNYKSKVWGRYGFTDSLNPKKNWFCKEYIGIDIGPILVNAENYRSGLIHKYFSKEPIVWSGLNRCNFSGVVDNFDPSEHSSPYAGWGTPYGRQFKLKKTNERVKEAENALLVEYDSPEGKYFQAKPQRGDFSNFKYLSFWLAGGDGMDVNVELAMQDGKSVRLKKETIMRSADQWALRYFALPAQMSNVHEVRFLVGAKGKGKFYIDDIALTNTVAEAGQDFLIDDFENEKLSRWVALKNEEISLAAEKACMGKKSLKINTNNGEASIKINFGTPQDWRTFHSISMKVYGNAEMWVSLKDKFGKSYQADWKVNNQEGWGHLFFNIQATLNPTNCWALRYDKQYITEMQIRFLSGEKAVFLDHVSLTD